jgi:hypothetical protein
VVSVAAKATAMSRKLTEAIEKCRRQAAECRESAHAADDHIAKEDFLDLERRWLLLARSYEFVDRLSASTKRLFSRRHMKD